jgi:hypothetical protein
LHGFDFSRLTAWNSITVNDAVFHVEHPACCYTGDYRWLASRGREATAICPVYAAIDERHAIFGQISGVTHLKRRRELGASPRRGEIYIGGCSGYGAIQLAAHGGATRIALLGFDLTPGRFLDSDQPEEIERYEVWAAQFKALAVDLDERGVAVVNCSKNSAITAFPKINWREVEEHGIHVLGRPREQ